MRVSVRWFLRSDEPWAPAGHLVAWDQVVVRRVVPKTSKSKATKSKIDAASRVDVPAVVDALDPRVTIWRAAVDNDGFKNMPEIMGFGGSLRRWQLQGIDKRDAELVRHATKRTANADGTVTFRHVIDVPKDLVDLPRVGVTFAVPPTFTQLHWVGEGPHECYPDRRASAMFGTWEAAPDELPYLVPQEFGLRTNCTRLQLVDPRTGETLVIDAVDGTFHFSATWHTANDLFTARDQTELRRREHLTVHLDAAHRGVGTASCGPDTLERYRVGAGRHTLNYRVSATRT